MSSGPADPADPLDVDGPAAPPRANGELVFTEPWQSRLFATTMKLHEAEHFTWDRFRAGLIAQIAAHEQSLTDTAEYDYWGCWQRALEDLLHDLDVVSAEEMTATSAGLAARPPGHDHGHPHDHDHPHHDH